MEEVGPLYSGRVTLSTGRNERSTVVWERPDGVPNVCVRFTLQGWKSDSNRPSLADIETA